MTLPDMAMEGVTDVAPTPGVVRGLLRSVAFSHCRLELPSFRFAGRRDAVSRLHRLALRLDAQRPPRTAWGETVLAMGLHACNAARQSLVYYRKHGDYVRRVRGLGRWRLLRLGWTCLFRNNQLPRHLYERHLFDEPDPWRWLAHLEHRHLTVLLGALNVRLPVHLLANKLLFAEHCRGHGLPVPATLAAWNGAGRVVAACESLPAADLYAKPFADFGGAGARPIPWCAAGGYEYAGRVLPAGELSVALARAAAGRGCLLQRRLRNPPDLACGLGESDIANVRIVTGLFPAESPRVLAAGLRVPSRFTTHGHDRSVLLAPVGLGDGRLGVAHVRGTCSAGWAKHPDTGADLAGWVLPRWSAMKELALAAHRTCPWMPFVGWDVVDADQGLVLLEANAYWGANAVQLPGALPLGETDFPAMYLAWHRHLGLSGGS